ncbi:MAG: hypothetical protein IPP46_17130 [Bacteroidetes bacterium]|nr:hypothetical protein [Bacteroidota bacterium]
MPALLCKPASGAFKVAGKYGADGLKDTGVKQDGSTHVKLTRSNTGLVVAPFRKVPFITGPLVAPTSFLLNRD